MIDFKFIAELEGNSLVGYVPDPENSNSGVTIAAGFDLGCRTRTELRKFNEMIDERDGCGLGDRLSGYALRQGVDAKDFLDNNPLDVTAEEAECINRYSHKEARRRLICEQWPSKDFIESTGDFSLVSWSELSSECKTIIASVSFQYGSLESKCPNFWRQVTTGDWEGALSNLRNFGDRYPTRRNKEADLLESWLRR